MKRFFLALFLLPTLCLAQGSHRISQILVKGSGLAANIAPFAKVKVCQVNTDCQVLAPIFADITLTVPLTNPVTADGSGNYNYYIASGCVDERISSPGQGSIFLPFVCPDNGSFPSIAPANTVLAGPVSGGPGNPSFQTNPTININGMATNVTGVVATDHGGTGTASPNLVPGSNVTITGTWPNQTISAAIPPGGAIVGAPSTSQAITQPINTDFNVVTSGTGNIKHNGSPVVDTVPTGNQTVSQPSGTTLAVNSLNGVFNEELFTGITVPDRVNTAIAACGSAPCYIIIPSYAPTGAGWTLPVPLNVSIQDQRFFNGIGFAQNANPDIHSYYNMSMYAGANQSWETKPETVGSGPFVFDIEDIASDGGFAHDGLHSNTGGILILTNRTRGNRPTWGIDVNSQYSNFNNVVNGIEVDLVNNNTVDDPGDGTAGIALQLVSSTSTHKSAGVGLLIGGDAAQGATFTTDVSLTAYKDTGLTLSSSATKSVDLVIREIDADPTKTAIAVTTNTIGGAQFAVFDDGSVRAANIQAQLVNAIGAPSTAANTGGQIAFNQTGAQELDLVSVYTSGPPGGFNFYSSTLGGALGVPIFSISGTGGAAWGTVGTPISDSAVVAQIGTVTVGQAACIKSTNPRTIGYCSNTPNGSGACTCN